MQKLSVTFLFILTTGLIALSAPARAQAPIIAVTDLTYEEKVREYFAFAASEERSGHRSSDDEFEGGKGRTKRQFAAVGEVVTIERGEWHKFTGDIRGALLKSGGYRLVQGRPWTDTDTVKIYDVIERIKKGFYPGAEYVLFGSVTDIQTRNEAVVIQGTQATNYTLSMDLVAEFSLINTKTYEIVAAFQALGEGSDQRLINTAGSSITLNRGRVVRDVSQSLSQNVLSEMTAQFPPAVSGGNVISGQNKPSTVPSDNSGGEKITTYH